MNKEPCLFCEMAKDRIIKKNKYAYAVYDGYPVTALHTLIVPKRHMPHYFELKYKEIEACNQLLKEMEQKIMEDDKTVSGFNIGINIGGEAGQTIFHCHIHLIPRRKGDHPNPRGGVRHIIPGKGDY